MSSQTTNFKLDYTTHGVRVFDRCITRCTTETSFYEFTVEYFDRQVSGGAIASDELALEAYLSALREKIGDLTDPHVHL